MSDVPETRARGGIDGDGCEYCKKLDVEKRAATRVCVYGDSPRAEEAAAKRVTSVFAKNIATLQRVLNEVDEKRDSTSGSDEGRGRERTKVRWEKRTKCGADIYLLAGSIHARANSSNH